MGPSSSWNEVRHAKLDCMVQACERYEAACALRSSSHAALYNHGVALSDLARHVRCLAACVTGYVGRFLRHA